MLSLASQMNALANAPTNSAESAAASVPYADYGLSALNASDRITLSSLSAETGGNLSLPSIESYINHNLVAYDIRRVLLDIGWQNYSVGTIPYEAWVNSWLTASDALGIQNVVYVGQLTDQGVGSPWVNSVIAADPAAQTYSANGSAVAYVSYDDPDIATFLEKDLSLIYSYYGSHPSWVGIGTGSSPNDPYYPTSQAVPQLGYSNLTISNFVNSAYYAADVNATGYLPNGTLDPLWASFKNIQPSIVMSSGTWMTSSAVNVYGQGTTIPSFVEMRFKLATNVTALTLSWYGNEVGSPGPMEIQIYPDKDGSLNHSGLLGNFTVSPGFFTPNLGWQNAPSIRMNLTEGYYWVVFESPESDSSNYYQMYMKDYLINDGTAYAQEGYVGPGLLTGSTVLWAKGQDGDTVALYPYQQVVVEPSPLQAFTAASSFSFNTIFLFLSDRDYNPTNGTITVEDVTAGDTVLATGVLSQALVHGIENWVPISLNTTITTVPGHSYLIFISEPNNGYSWSTVLRGVTTDPSSAGFQGQSSYLLFELADVNLGQGYFDFGGIGSNGVDAVRTGYMNAVRFMTSSNESLESVQVLMTNNARSGNYTSGTFTISIWNSSASGSNPSLPSLQQITVPASEVPANGWLDVGGFNQSVMAGHYYWIVFSADSNNSFTISRMTSTYAFDVLDSSNGGANWSQPREGPTEFAFVVSLSNQQLGNFISGNPTLQIGTSDYFAQPFYTDETSQIDGVFIGPLAPGPSLFVSIDLNTGDNTPSLTPVASGIFNARDITLDYGLQFVQFSSVANLQAGQKYWIVIQPVNGSYSLSPMVYLPNAPAVPSNLSAMVSEDSGLNWTRVSNTTSFLPYELASPVIALPQLNTTTAYRYLSIYHSSSTSNGTVRGWTGYLAASELTLFGKVTAWLSEKTDQNFTFFGQGQANVLSQLPAKDFVIFPPTASASSCSSLSGQLQSQIPINGIQYYNVADSNLIASCRAGSVGVLVRQLGYMLGTGQTFGQGSATRVLVVGDGVSDSLTRFLSVAYDATYTQLALDPRLGNEGNLSTFTAILWASSVNPFNSATGSQIKEYVQSGGTLVLVQFGGDESDLSSVFASMPAGNTDFPPPTEVNLTRLIDHTSYEGLSLSNSSGGISGNSSQLALFLRPYGAGAVYASWFLQNSVSQVSDPIVVISNIISAAASLQAPFWYGSLSPDPSMAFNVAEEGTGTILIWATNAGTVASSFSLNLNGSYYGIGSSWKVVNMNSMVVTSGLGSDILVRGNLTAGTWLPLYIVPSSSGLVDYSNVVVKDQYIYPHQSLFKLDSVAGQNALVLLSSNASAGELLVNDNATLPNLYSVSNFSAASNGWVYLNSTDTLLAKFVSGGASSLRFLAYTEPVRPLSVLPLRTLLALLIITLCVELVALAAASYYRRSRPRGQGLYNYTTRDTTS
jgi:hypothetical protein